MTKSQQIEKNPKELKRPKPGVIKAGVSCVDITPPKGTQLSGGVGVYRPAETVADPLFAKAIVLESGERKLCLVALDLCIITKDYCDHIRHAARERFGFEYDAVMVHPLQIHSAPSVGNFMLSEDYFKNIPEEFSWLGGGDSKYTPLLVEKTVEAI